MHFAASLLIVLSLYTSRTWCQLTTTEPFYVYLDEAYTETLLPFAGYYIQFHNCGVATYKNRNGFPVDILGNPFVKPSRPTIGLSQLLDNSKDLAVTCKYDIKGVPHEKTLQVPRVAYAKTSPHCSKKLKHCGNPQRSLRKHYCDITSMGFDCSGYNAGKLGAFYTTTDEACVQIGTDIRFDVRSLGAKAKDAVTFADELLLVQPWGGYHLQITSTEQGDIQCWYTECSFVSYQKRLAAGELTRTVNMLTVTDALAAHDMIKVECKQDITPIQGPQQISFPFYVVKNDSLTFTCPSAQHPEPNCTAPIWLSEGTKRVTHISNGKYLCSYTFQLCYPNRKQLSLESTITCPISSSTREQSSTTATVESTAETSTSVTSKSTYAVTEPSTSPAATSAATTKKTTQRRTSETTDKMTTATTAATSSEWGTNSTAATKEQTTPPITTKTKAQSTQTTADTTTAERTPSPTSTTEETTAPVTTEQTDPPVTTKTEGQTTPATTYTATVKPPPSPTSDATTIEETTSAMTTEPTTPPVITKTRSQATEATTVDIPPSSTSTADREETTPAPATEQTSPVTPAHSGRTSSTDGNGAGRGVGSGKPETSTPLLYIILPVASGLLILIVALACIITQRKASRDARQLAAPSEAAPLEATDNRYVVVKQQQDIAMAPAQAASENSAVEGETQGSPMALSAASETEDKPSPPDSHSED